MSKKEQLEDYYRMVEEITDYIIDNEFSKEERESLEELLNESSTLVKELTEKLNPLYD